MDNCRLLRIFGMVLAAILLIVTCGVAEIPAKAALRQRSTGSDHWLKEVERNKPGWRLAETVSDQRLIRRAKTAGQCLVLADKEIVLGFWRLHLLRSGIAKDLRPPVEANWAAAVHAFRRGGELVADAAKRGQPVPAAEQASLISHRAMFLFHLSPQANGDILRTIKAVRCADRIVPKSSEVLSELALLYDHLSLDSVSKLKARNALQKSIKCARDAIKADPRCTMAFWAIGGAQVGLGDLNAAINSRIRALMLTRFTDPAVCAYDYHYLNFWTRTMAEYVKDVRPKTYRKIRDSIAYFSPDGKVLLPGAGKPKQ